MKLFMLHPLTAGCSPCWSLHTFFLNRRKGEGLTYFCYAFAFKLFVVIFFVGIALLCLLLYFSCCCLLNSKQLVLYGNSIYCMRIVSVCVRVWEGKAFASSCYLYVVGCYTNTSAISLRRRTSFCNSVMSWKITNNFTYSSKAKTEI